MSVDLGLYQTEEEWSRYIGDKVSLNLSEMELGDEDMIAFAKALEKAKNLQRVDLSGNKISAVGAQALADALLTNRLIASNPISGTEALNLTNNPLGIKGFEAIIDAFYKTDRYLHCVRLNGTLTGENEAEIGVLAKNNIIIAMYNRMDIARRLIYGGDLVDLDEGDSETLKVAEQIYELINGEKRPRTEEEWEESIGADQTSLNLKGQNLSDKSIVNLAKALGKGHNITAIDLSGNKITAVGARALADALLVNRHIASDPMVHTAALNLSNNQFGKDGIVAVLKAFHQTGRFLHCIALQNNGLDDKSKKELYEIPEIVDLKNRSLDFSLQ